MRTFSLLLSCAVLRALEASADSPTTAAIVNTYRWAICRRTIRVALILVDYPHRMRLKILGHARIVSADEHELLAKLETPKYRARVERGFTIKVAAFDWNCPQHITPRFTASEIDSVIQPLKARVTELESQLKECLRAKDPLKTASP